MRDHIQHTYNCRFIRFGEYDPETGADVFECIHFGEYIIADSLALMLSELQSRTHRALKLAA